jgi:hypothetical protein
MAIPSSERSLAASIAAHESWASTPNRAARTAPARAALDAKFLEQADGDPVAAAHLRKAHFARLALKSAQARRRSRELEAVADAAETELSALGGAKNDAA